MRTYSLFILFSLLTIAGRAQQITVTDVRNVVCPGNMFKVDYTVSGSFNSGNTFRVELSGANGAFGTTPNYIGQVQRTTSGSITCTLPIGTAAATLYRVRVVSTSPNVIGQENPGDISVKNYPLPKLVSDDTACEGGSFEMAVLNALNQNPEVSYLWRWPNGAVLNGNAQSVKQISANVGMAGRYVLEATYYGCYFTDTTGFIVIKPRAEKPTVTAEDTLCPGNTLHLSASSTTPGATYKWNGPNGFTSSAKDTAVAGLSAQASGYYKVEAYLDGCPSLPDSALVVLKNAPAVNANNNGPMCAGGTLILRGNDNTPNATYTWTGPGGFSSSAEDTGIINVQVANSGAYIFTVNDGSCAAYDTVNVTIKPNPEKPDAQSNTPVCSDTTLMLRPGNKEAGVQYLWQGPDAYTSTDAEPDITKVSLAAAGTYIVTADKDGCKRADTIEVVIKPTPLLPIITSNSPLREGETLRLNISNPESDVRYNWTGPDNFTDSSTAPEIPDAEESASGVYVVTAERNGCINAAQTIVVVSTPKDTGVYVLFPNPNNGYFSIRGYAKTNQQITLEIHNSVGQSVFTHTVLISNNLLDEKIAIPHVANGVYSLQFRADAKRQVIPFVITR